MLMKRNKNKQPKWPCIWQLVALARRGHHPFTSAYPASASKCSLNKVNEWVAERTEQLPKFKRIHMLFTLILRYFDIYSTIKLYVEQKLYVVICTRYYHSFYSPHNVSSNSQAKEKQEILMAEKITGVALFWVHIQNFLQKALHHNTHALVNGPGWVVLLQQRIKIYREKFR